MPIYPSENKRMSLAEAASLVQDGMTLAIGGGLSWREPMAFLREIIRQGRRDLRVIGTAHGIDVDLLCGAGAISVVEESYVGFEHDFGMAPNFRGLPLVLVPALSPDVAIVHAHYGDAQGNLKILPPLVADLFFIRASKHVIATVEKLLPIDELREMEPNVPYFWVESVVEIPYGAHPTSCYPFYAYDREHLAEYHQAAQKGPEVFADQYLTHVPAPQAGLPTLACLPSVSRSER